MGIYLNPGNSGFERIRKDKYVDKTGMIELMNASVGTSGNLTCISRPRRFGKSYAAQMLCAYYDHTCHSAALFDDLKIAAADSYREHLNRYDVIYLDMTNILGETEHGQLVDSLKEKISKEITAAYPEVLCDGSFSATLVNTVEYTGRQFVMIIDEWDAPIRENSQIEKSYLEFLRTLFKSSGTTARIFAAVYMTGILPIKKDGSQSAISDFYEYTMIKPFRYAEFAGFTEKEVKLLCSEYQVDFDTMKRWYDGYAFQNVGSIYNPNSVMKAIINRDFDSYWTQTSLASGLMDFITRDYAGLAKTVAELIAGLEVKVDTLGFSNDLRTFHGKDDVLTLLIHLGYLAYNAETGKARIPNEEVRQEFSRAVRSVSHTATIARLQESDRLILDTVNGNEEAVAAQIEKIHEEETAPLHYNREDSLRSVIKLAYYAYKDHYLQWEELPAGVGYADLVYLPKPDSGYPALVIELKWNDSAEGAIAQIKDKNYPSALRDYNSAIILVGINYDKNAPAGQRKHSCKIEKVCRSRH